MPEIPRGENRYLLYVTFICPYAQRAAIVRQLKGLEEYLPLAHVNHQLDSNGWRFATKEELASVPEGDTRYGTADPLYGFERINQLYKKASSEGNIVNNESGEMIRFFNTEFNEVLPEEYSKIDIYPQELQAQIDKFVESVADVVAQKAYKTAFAGSEDDFQDAYSALLEALKSADEHLAQSQANGSQYAVGSSVTEADIKLYTSTVRLSQAYYKGYDAKVVSLARDYPHLHKWLKNLYQIPAFKDTTDFLKLTLGAESKIGHPRSEKFEAVLDLDK
ncbi:hypothetical protein CA7LBN_000787 [Candidozyma auris]|uniref:GST C-terminal domain-containing protein n=1 Tax=Candidozyma auris TaxID=498019 RepID=A0A8F2VYE2_CANAR|nr:hypothetical protein CA7LBN_000787 [[Candida] auris]